jgi:hypothetical protein
MGIINEEMEPGEGPAHEQAETPPVEQQEDQAEASGMPEQDGMPNEDDATPEEEDAYEKGVIAIMRVLYDSGAADGIVESIASVNGNPDAIAKATLQLMKSIDEATGGQIPETVLAPLATEALTQIVELVEAAGVEVGGRGIAQALQIMLLDFMTEYGADPAQIQQALSTVDTDAIGKLIDQQRGAQ